MNRTCGILALSVLLPIFSVGILLAAPTAGGKKTAPVSGIAAQGTGTTLTFVDPRTGRLLWKAQARSLDAQTGSSGSVTGTLHDVHGVLYQAGAPVDRIIAPTVSADQAAKTVIATGGVTVQSIAEAGTSIRCDKLTWHADTNILLGTGSVVFKKGGFTQTGPSVQGDTRMRTLVMPAPSLARRGREAVRVSMHSAKTKR